MYVSQDVKSSRSTKKKLRNFQRALNRKIRPNNYLDLKTQLESGSERWKNFTFDRDCILRHLYC